MIDMGTAGDQGGGWPERGRRFAASPHAPVIAGVLLGIAAMTEAIVRGAGTGMSVVGLVGVCALAAGTTVPLAFLGPVAAAVAICAANVLSLAAFHTLTVAGLTAQLIVLYRLGRSGASRSGGRPNQATRDAAWFLAPALAVPLLVLAVAEPGRAGSEEGVLVVLLVALAPAAALTGIAQRARSEALAHSQARQVISCSTLGRAHGPRGAGCSIAREPHDGERSPISMTIAVQAAMPPAGHPGDAQPRARDASLEIGDTARASTWTEMRRIASACSARTREAADSRPGRCRPPSQPGSASSFNQLLDEARDAAVGHGHQAHHFRGPPRPSILGVRACRLPHRPGSAHQCAAARAGRRWSTWRAALRG